MTAKKLNPPTTEEIIDAMLKENTGKHFLDSGGSSGRAWQQNAGKDFRKVPQGTLDVHIYKKGTHKADWSPTLSTYHFLCERVEFVQEWQDKFDAFVATQSADDSWLSLMHGFVDHLRESGHYVRHPFGTSEKEPLTVNTYNHQSFLSQVLQYVAVEVDHEPLYLLQIHGGADVRGGYTAPKCFTDSGMSEWALFDDNRACISCDKCGANWLWDGGHFGFDGSTSDPLDEYPVVERGTEYNGLTITRPMKGLVYLYADKNVSCPKCAKGKLNAYPF